MLTEQQKQETIEAITHFIKTGSTKGIEVFYENKWNALENYVVPQVNFFNSYLPHRLIKKKVKVINRYQLPSVIWVSSNDFIKSAMVDRIFDNSLQLTFSIHIDNDYVSVIHLTDKEEDLRVLRQLKYSSTHTPSPCDIHSFIIEE